MKDLQESSAVADGFEDQLSRSVAVVRQNTLTQKDRHRTSRLSQVQSKVICHNSSASPKKSRSPKKGDQSAASPQKDAFFAEPAPMLSERIAARNSEIEDME